MISRLRLTPRSFALTACNLLIVGAVGYWLTGTFAGAAAIAVLVTVMGLIGLLIT
jgi:uncharacterized membrane protein